MNTPYWESKSLQSMTKKEWELLCDHCAKCCLHKLEDDVSGEIFYTDIACELLDLEQCRCRHYQNRAVKMPTCIDLRTQDLSYLLIMPETCAYRRVYEGKPLPSWHPLLVGDSKEMHNNGQSIKGRAVSAKAIHVDDYEERIIQWVNDEVSTSTPKN